MSRQLIMVSSITYAIRGRDLLRSKGLKAYIEKTPIRLDRAGCGYSVAVPQNAESARRILTAAGIKTLGIAEV